MLAMTVMVALTTSTMTVCAQSGTKQTGPGKTMPVSSEKNSTSAGNGAADKKGKSIEELRYAKKQAAAKGKSVVQFDNAIHEINQNQTK